MSHRLHSLRMENDAAGYALDELRPRFARLAGRHENGTAPRAVTAYQLFQTPVPIAAQLVALLDLQPGARVLEPSAGLGRILDALRPYASREIVAVEIAPQCARELFLRSEIKPETRNQKPGTLTIKQRDFLTCTPEDLGLFDAVAMNPPFHLRNDIRHIRHALKFLKPGGKLASVCMDNTHRWEKLKPITDLWVNLPEKSFKESGTHIGAALVLIKNH